MKQTISSILAFLLVFAVLTVAGAPVFALNSTMAISDAVYPTYLDEQMSFSISGTITSNTNITSVTVGVYRKSSGQAVLSKTQYPNAKTYNVSSADPYLVFGSLSEDNYIYKITASDGNVSDKVLLSKDFVVGLPNGTVGDKMTDVDWKVIDISEWQPDVNWSTLKNEVDAIILRIGYRTTGTLKVCEDSSFYDHYQNAVEHGIPVGVYFYSVALSVDAAVEEAEFVIDTLKKYNCKLTMPVYIDMEFDSQLALGRTMCTKIAHTFCERILEENYFPGVYCNLNWARTALVMSSLADYTIWYAQYSSSPSYKGKFEMWQYSESGYVNGISDKVDLNKCYKDIPAYIKSLDYSGEIVPKYADYTELDQLILMVPTSFEIYKPEAVTAVESALTQAKAVNRNLTYDKQSTIDAAASKLKSALCSLVISGSFEENQNSDIKLDDENQKIFGIPQNTTTDKLLSDYITLKGDAYIEYANLSDGKIVNGTIIYIKIKSETIAKYVVVA